MLVCQTALLLVYALVVSTLWTCLAAERTLRTCLCAGASLSCLCHIL